MLGVLQPLTIADSTGRTGRFNLAQGFVGAVSSIGASLSTTVSGMIVGNFGLAAGFVAVAVIALIAFSVLWALMPETKPADDCYALHSQDCPSPCEPPATAGLARHPTESLRAGRVPSSQC
jgi:MFS family permease